MRRVSSCHHQASNWIFRACRPRSIVSDVIELRCWPLLGSCNEQQRRSSGCQYDTWAAGVKRAGMGDAAPSVWERFWVIRHALQLLEPQSAMVMLPINPRLERRGIGQGAPGEVRSGIGRAQRTTAASSRAAWQVGEIHPAGVAMTTFVKRSKEKMRQEKQSAKALDRQQLELVLAGFIPGPQPLVLV